MLRVNGFRAVGCRLWKLDKRIGVGGYRVQAVLFLQHLLSGRSGGRIGCGPSICRTTIPVACDEQVGPKHVSSGTYRKLY